VSVMSPIRSAIALAPQCRLCRGLCVQGVPRASVNPHGEESLNTNSTCCNRYLGALRTNCVTVLLNCGLPTRCLATLRSLAHCIVWVDRTVKLGVLNVMLLVVLATAALALRK
jgi:hypothetical protein